VGLTGKKELQLRMKAIGKDVFKPAGKQWADETVRLMRQRVPDRNTRYSKGKLHDSIRRKSATQHKAVVEGRYTGYFVDAGVKPHSLQRRKSRPKGSQGRLGRTIFAAQARKVHPGYKARPFRARSARDALKRYPMSAEVIKVWNRAA
jgi:hypothetical protein